MPSTRTLAAVFALGRMSFGAGLIVAPHKVAAGWIGADARREPVKIVVRGLGARDVALSAATLSALGDERALATSVVAAIGCDLCDIAATLTAPANTLPANARWGTVALVGASAAAGAALLAAVRR